jgi:hypothetical protein
VSILGSDIFAIKGNVTGRLGLATSTLEVPAESPFSALGLEGCHRMTMYLSDMNFVSSVPKVIGQCLLTKELRSERNMLQFAI